jgi:inosine-uridine nucleoside N-ribohydrolase
MPIPILLDTDIGTDVDDAIALALAVASPEVDLRAVTVVSGDVGRRAQIAKKLLALAGHDTVPVAAGVRDPILRRRNFLWLGHEGQGILAPDERLALSPLHGVDVLIDTVMREQPHVVAIGPLSNLAVAIMKTPEVIAAIPHLTLMGGVLGINADPDLPPVEYNLDSDAEAAMVVLSAGIPTTIVPLDVTWRAVLTKADLDCLRTAGSRLVQTVCDAIEIWWPVHREFFAGTRTYRSDIVAFLHDPLALTAVFNRSFLRCERRRLRPTLVDDHFRLVDDRTAPEIEIAVDVDRTRFVDFLTDRLLAFGVGC